MDIIHKQYEFVSTHMGHRMTAYDINGAHLLLLLNRLMMELIRANGAANVCLAPSGQHGQKAQIVILVHGVYTVEAAEEDRSRLLWRLSVEPGVWAAVYGDPDPRLTIKRSGD